jgi:glycosyltransferase involved in cell wall biosynthesis
VTGTVLLLAPSRGLGGGIERYVSTVEDAFTGNAVPYRRLDLILPGLPGGTGRRIGFVREVRRAVRSTPDPVRLVLAHRNLLPVVHAVSRYPGFAGATVVLHGSELWSASRARGARTMRRPDVRVVAGSTFTAGAVAHLCRPRVLHPGVSAAWYDTLVRAGERTRPAGERRLQLVTAFRLASWREKGLETLLAAVPRLGTDRVRLTVCGRGPVPDDLRAAVAAHPWCRLAADLSDQDLAGQLGGADLFVLCTRTRAGRGACGEGFGLVLLEAQLAGTPVVAPAHGGSSDAFLPEVTGVAPVDETPVALCAVLASLLADARRRAEWGRAAAAWSRARFEPVAYGRRVVRALLDEPASAPFAPADHDGVAVGG